MVVAAAAVAAAGAGFDLQAFSFLFRLWMRSMCPALFPGTPQFASPHALTRRLVMLAAAVVLGGTLPACEPRSSHSASHSATHDHRHDDITRTPSLAGPSASTTLAHFAEADLVSPAELVECVLETGQESTCIEVVMKYKPDGLDIGPFCPQTTDDAGGIWHWTGQDAGLYRVNGAFFAMIADQGYPMADADGLVHVADISQAQPEHEHSCIAVSPKTDVTVTALIPAAPQIADQASGLGIVAMVGVSVLGVPIFADAPPVEHTGHMPSLDVCGGHVDPGGWYHWHGNSSDLHTVFAHENVEATCHLHQDASGLFGYAFDGFPIYGSVDATGHRPDDLDGCGGHVGPMPDGRVGYHYHTSTTFPNLPNCLSGVQALARFSTTATAGIGAARGGRAGGFGEGPLAMMGPGRGPNGGGPPGGGGPGGAGMGPPPDFSQAARLLGVSGEELAQAVIAHGGRDLDVAAAAKSLGVSAHALQEALRTAPPAPPRRNGPP